jgi:hypothetical protein
MRMEWDQDTKRLYEAGVDRVALSVVGPTGYGKCVPWNGITKIDDKPSGAEVTKKYANNNEYAALQTKEKAALTIEAFTYPDEFYPCNGMKMIGSGLFIHQQTRSKFGLVYRNLIGNDTEGTDHGVKYHVVYGCLAKPSEVSHETVNEDMDISPMSWEVDASAPSYAPEGYKPSAEYTIDSTKCTGAQLTAFEDLVYGSDKSEPTFPTPEQLVQMFPAGAVTPAEG